MTQPAPILDEGIATPTYLCGDPYAPLAQARNRLDLALERYAEQQERDALSNDAPADIPPAVVALPYADVVTARCVTVDRYGGQDPRVIEWVAHALRAELGLDEPRQQGGDAPCKILHLPPPPTR